MGQKGGDLKAVDVEPLDDIPMMTGKVLSFKQNSGWIACDDGSGDAYVHYSEINQGGYKELQEGQIVQFNLIEQNGGRLKAENVSIIRGGGYGYGGRGRGRGRGGGRG